MSYIFLFIFYFLFFFRGLIGNSESNLANKRHLLIILFVKANLTYPTTTMHHLRVLPLLVLAFLAALIYVGYAPVVSQTVPNWGFTLKGSDISKEGAAAMEREDATKHAPAQIVIYCTFIFCLYLVLSPRRS